jgi:hypothetical protein
MVFDSENAKTPFLKLKANSYTFFALILYIFGSLNYTDELYVLGEYKYFTPKLST